MNYLAHAYLSLNDPKIQVGNLIGDFIKGKKYLQYEAKIQQGILLHRAIDSFTDTHEIVQQAITYFKPTFRLSGGVFIDILFDHFLANDTRYFTQEKLYNFTLSVYDNLTKHEACFSTPMLSLFSYMSQYNWLYNYQYHEGLEKSILGICKRHEILGNGQEAIDLIQTHYHKLQECYQLFFPELLFFVEDKKTVV